MQHVSQALLRLPLPKFIRPEDIPAFEAAQTARNVAEQRVIELLEALSDAPKRQRNNLQYNLVRAKTRLRDAEAAFNRFVEAPAVH